MAHALGLGIVAEGIENQEQVDRLGAAQLRLRPRLFHWPADDRQAGERRT